MLKKSAVFNISLFLVFALIFQSNVSFAETPGASLQQAIQEKAKTLQQIQVQKDIVQKNIDEIGKTKDSLKKEIKTYDTNINGLNLSLESTRLTIDKLGLEVESLGGDINKIKLTIQDRETTVLKLFTELQQKDRQNFFYVLLKNQTLSQSIDEARSIELLNNGLSSSISELKKLEISLSDKLDESQSKKYAKEIQKIDLANRQQIVQEQKTEKQKLLDQTKDQEKNYQDLLSKIEELQGQISIEIERIESELRKNINPNLLPLPRPFVLLKPVVAPITQGYGRTKFAATHYRSKYHNAIDFGAPIGTEVMAAEKGTVINVGNQDLYCNKAAYGKFIVIKHENGLTTLYGHLSKYIVSVGQKVNRGELIGYVGKTGFATGPHLHFTVFASQTLTPARPGLAEGAQYSPSCKTMPVGGDLDPNKYL